ncbi:pseudouridine synthase, partial [Oleiphilus sp. HI0079]|uniref:pseudouridine synthase n=2 Tax=Oleiphilus TaxID=141450 RepID=UPI000AFB296B
MNKTNQDSPQDPTLIERSRQEDEKLEILFQDAHLIAVHKPAGMLVHKSPIDKQEKRYAMRILRNQIGQWVYPVHRLDKP